MTEYPKNISKENRLNWFPCEPTRLLGAISSMRAPKQLVYLVTLLRIYECGGGCSDTIETLALRTRLNKKVVTDALSELFKEHRLYSGEGGIRNWKSDEVIADSFALREKRKTAGANGGKRRAEKSKENQHQEPSNATAPLQHGSTHLQEHKQDSLFSNENRVPMPTTAKPKVAKPKPEPEAVVDDGWPEDYLERFWSAFPPYRLAGKRKVGEKLERLRRDKAVTWEALIAGVRRYAATNPGEYAAGPMPWLNGEKWDLIGSNNKNGGNGNGENRDNRGPRLGAAGIAQRLRQSIAERERAGDPPEFFPAAGHEPADGRRDSAPALGSMDRAGQASSGTAGFGAFGASGSRSPDR